MKTAWRNIARLPRAAKVEYLALIGCALIVAWCLGAIFGPALATAYADSAACGFLC